MRNTIGILFSVWLLTTSLVAQPEPPAADITFATTLGLVALIFLSVEEGSDSDAGAASLGSFTQSENVGPTTTTSTSARGFPAWSLTRPSSDRPRSSVMSTPDSRSPVTSMVTVSTA